MSNKITFLNDLWLWPIIAVSVLLLAIFIWKEFACSGRKRIFIKVLLSFLAIVSLSLIALRPMMPRAETAGRFVVLSPGYEKEQLDSLKKENPGLKTIEYSPKNRISEGIQSAEVVYMLGYGLKPYDLFQLENISVVHLPPGTPKGIIKLKFPARPFFGDNFSVQGIYNKPAEGNRLVLQGPGGEGLDSLELIKSQEQRFSLNTTLKAQGNFVYFLAEKDAEGQVVSRDPVPVQVEEKPIMKILILNNFPTFETKYLKNFLAEAGHEVVIQSQLTRGRFKYEYFNTPRVSIGNLSRETLGPFDLLIIDAPTLRAITGSRLKEVQIAMREDGLGVLIQPDEAFLNAPGNMFNLRFKRQADNEVKLEAWPEVSLSSYLFIFDTSPAPVSIYMDRNSIISGYTRHEQGRIGSTVLSNTWQLVLEGNTDAYTHIWSRILETLGKRENLTYEMEQQTQFIFPDEPYHFNVRTQISDPEILNNDGRVLPLIHDLNFPDKWKAGIWPREKGWNSIQWDSIIVQNFYVVEEGSWKALTSQNTLEENIRHFSRPVNMGQKKYPLEPINPLWFYAVFLLSMGGLWLVPKF